MTEDGRTTSVAHWLEDDFRKNGGVMNHETGIVLQNVRNPYCRLHWIWLGSD